MLKVYSAAWCPHCQKAIHWLEKNDVTFEVINIETASREIVDQVVEVNGGEDWVVPTLEFRGKWREGKVFDPEGLRRDLVELGVL